MNLRQSHRKQAKIKLALEGCSGSGKTYSSLLLAYGMTNDWTKIAIIDTENGSADLYAHLGQYNVLTLQAPFTPEKYIEAIAVCETAGMEVIIIDSISHCWDYLLEYHSSLQGNSFTNWGKITPRQNAFIQKILSSTSHVISTMRTKQDYVLNERNGKMIPEKVGLKAIMRDGVDYEFTIVFDMDIKHYVTTSKDRKLLPSMEFTDTHINAVAKSYYNDDNFCVGEQADSISLWNVYNLFTGANKNSYIDNLLDRSLNATELVHGINKALHGDSQYKWFIE